MLITPPLPVALYARVSTDRQVESQSVESQLHALRERIAQEVPAVLDASGSLLEFIDDGYSGSTLVRPALERLRDLAATGGVERVYVHSPDRLARKYAHQALLLEEFSHAGVRVVFLNRAIQQTPEDELLVQVQGVIAEYERAKIIERTRRGRRHAAQRGSVSALAHAPYGYRYRGKVHGADLPQYEVVLDEARIVQQLFAWIGRDHLTIGRVTQRLQEHGVLTTSGHDRWNRSTVRQILQNPAYKGEAAYGRTRSIPWRRLALRPAQHHPEHPRRTSSTERRPAAEWIAIPTPALVDPALFAAVQEQLAENKRRRREQRREPRLDARFLLQGLLVCGACGAAFCGNVTRYHTRDGQARARGYYRCLGSDAHRSGGVRLCPASPLAAPPVETAVWAEVCQLLEDPARVEQEYSRRWRLAQATPAPPAERANEAQVRKLRQGLARLIDSYAEGLISKEEFEPRITRLRQRIAYIEQQVQRERDDTRALRELQLVTSQLESFAVQVRNGLADADWRLRRAIVQTLIKRIEVTDAHITVIFRVGASALGPAPPDVNLQHWWPRLAVDLAQAGPAALRRLADRLRRSPSLSRLGLTLYLEEGHAS
jgi:site-specific DNA recombinase